VRELEKITYLGLPNCLRLSNGTAEVVVTTDVGPRVLGYAFAGGENILGEHPDAAVETEWGVFRPYGGHRLWTAPEATPRSYSPDNSPLTAIPEGALGVRLLQEADARTGTQKEMTVTLDREGAGVSIVHRVTNRGVWPVELAPWALTIMRPGGVVVIPQEPFGPHPEHLLPARPLVLWPYTDLTDARLALGRRFIRVKVDERRAEPQKIGLLNKRGWAAYHAGATLFVKRYGYEEGARYPDYGCNTEVFTAGPFVEVESLAPLTRLGPGEAAEHEERWELYDSVILGDDEESVEAALGPLVGRSEGQ
jgi:hypothetical protein